MPEPTPTSDADLPLDLAEALAEHGVAARDEAGLRRALEARLPGYTLYRLMPAARKRWKCQYRIMYGATYHDCQSVAEAYARALLAILADVHAHEQQPAPSANHGPSASE